MKLKNINFFERHFEKFIILVALCVLGYSLYHWGLSTPYKVTLDNQEVTAGRVDEVISQKTQQLETVLASDEINPALANLKIDRIGNKMLDEMRRPLLHQPGDLDVAVDEMPYMLGMVTSPGKRIGIGRVEPTDPYHEPTVPQPTVTIAKASLRTINPDEFLNNPDVATEVLNAEHPDLAEVTIKGEFDMLEMIKQLTFEPPVEQLRLPEDWWFNKFEIVRVEVERREQLEDGSWSEPEMIQAIPGSTLADARRIPDRINLDSDAFKSLTEQQRSAVLPNLVKWIQLSRSSIVQPPFPDTIGPVWSVPRKLTEEELRVAGEAGQLKIKITELQTQLEQRIKRIQKLESFGQGSPGGAPTPGPGPVAIPGEFGPEGGTPRPGATRPRPTPTPGGNAAANARQRQIDNWKKLAEKTQAEIDELQAQYKELTGEVVEQERPNRLNPTYGEGGFEGEFGPGAPGAYPGGYDEFGPAGRGQIDPRTGRPIAPGIGQRIDPRTGRPIAPGGRTTPQIDPRTGRPVAPGGIIDGGGVVIEGDDPALEGDSPEALARRLATSWGGEKIDIWQTDINVEPGKTYQYRFIVKVLNPLYDKPTLPGKIEDKDSQKARHHDLFLLSSKPSEWCEPVKVDRMSRVFVYDAQPNPKPGQVTFHVHRFSWGQWRVQEFEVRPGDPIGGVVEVDDPNLPAVVDIDFGTGMYCLDIEFDFKVQAPGGLVTRRVPRALIADGDDVFARRKDHDREAEEQWKKDLALQGEFAGLGDTGATTARR